MRAVTSALALALLAAWLCRPRNAPRRRSVPALAISTLVVAALSTRYRLLGWLLAAARPSAGRSRAPGTHVAPLAASRRGGCSVDRARASSAWKHCSHVPAERACRVVDQPVAPRFEIVRELDVVQEAIGGAVDRSAAQQRFFVGFRSRGADLP